MTTTVTIKNDGGSHDIELRLVTPVVGSFRTSEISILKRDESYTGYIYGEQSIMIKEVHDENHSA